MSCRLDVLQQIRKSGTRSRKEGQALRGGMHEPVLSTLANNARVAPTEQFRGSGVLGASVDNMAAAQFNESN